MKLHNIVLISSNVVNSNMKYMQTQAMPFLLHKNIKLWII